MTGIAAIASDCFGTLANFEEADFVRTFGELSVAAGLSLTGRELWDRWLEQGRELSRARGRDPQQPLAGPEPVFVPFREIWLRQFERTFEPLGAKVSAADARNLIVNRLSAAECYAGAAEVLSRLRVQHRIALLSNADDDFLAACLARNGLAFETIVSSESARSYKPRRPIFENLCFQLGLPAQRILYVGDSPVADVLGARTAGMPVAWINRAGVPIPEKIPPPDLELRNLSELIGALTDRVSVTQPPA